MNLEVSLLNIDKVEPNPWNPNVQNEQQFKAEIESITNNGFLAPILVRAFDDHYQIIDGEHRLKALKEIIEKKIEGKRNVPDLVKSGQIPSIVIDVDDANAKKLTIIMNETRGRADFAKLGALLTEIKVDLPDDLAVGLPYTETQLNELMEIATFSWDALDTPITTTEFEDDGEGGDYKISAILSPETGLKWKSMLYENKNELPTDTKLAAGALITRLIAKSETL